MQKIILSQVTLSGGDSDWLVYRSENLPASLSLKFRLSLGTPPSISPVLAMQWSAYLYFLLLLLCSSFCSSPAVRTTEFGGIKQVNRRWGRHVSQFGLQVRRQFDSPPIFC